MYITKNFKETQELGKQFAERVKAGGVIALRGDLGSGKTTFVQGLARGLGIKGKIISPTFIIVRKYDIPHHSTIQPSNHFYHIDLYRVENEKDVKGLGLEEILSHPKSIVAIEWPEKIENLLPEKKVNLYFEYTGDNKRLIKTSAAVPTPSSG